MNQYQTATDGNVVQTAEVDTAPGQPFTLALGFGADAAAAIGVARASATRPFGQILGSYLSGWRAYDRTLRLLARRCFRPGPGPCTGCQPT